MFAVCRMDIFVLNISSRAGVLSENPEQSLGFLCSIEIATNDEELVLPSH
jgi:hypothetical protein